MNQGYPCRGYPCGKEEIGAANLANCLWHVHGWESTCGYMMKAPSNIKLGDVLVYHSGSCEGTEAHATIVTDLSNGVRISCHSPSEHNVNYYGFASDKPYYQWLRYVGPTKQ